MKQLTCEMCGSTDLLKQDGVFVCQTCGCKYSVEEAKKMMIDGTVEVTGSVKVDVSEKVKNLYVMARRAKDDDNAELAAKYYEMITFENPFDWEALFYFNYFKAEDTTLKNMTNSVITLSNSLDNVFDLIDKSEKTADEKFSIAQEIIEHIDTLCDSFISWAKNHYKKFSEVKGSGVDLIDRASTIADLQKTIQVNYQMGHYGVNAWYSSSNSAGGVSVRFSIKNIGTKAIKYYTLWFAPYNAVGDIVKCTIHKASESAVSGTGPLAPNGIKRNCLFENAWYNSSIKSVKLVKAEIEYMDGTKEIIQGDQITSIGYSNTTQPKSESCTAAKIFYILCPIVPVISVILMLFGMFENSGDSGIILFLLLTVAAPIIIALIGRVIDELNWKNKK